MNQARLSSANMVPRIMPPNTMRQANGFNRPEWIYPKAWGSWSQTDHPNFLAAADQVIAAAKTYGEFAGIHLMSAALERWNARE